MAVRHADFACLGVHCRHPVLHRTCRAFGEYDSTVIGGDGRHAMQQIVDGDARIGGQEHGRTLAMPCAEGLRPYRVDLLREQPPFLHPFEGEERRHDLGYRGRHEAPVDFSLIQDLTAARIEQIGDRRCVFARDRRRDSRRTLCAERGRKQSRCEDGQRNHAIGQLRSRAGQAPRLISRLVVSGRRYNRARGAWRAPAPPVHG